MRESPQPEAHGGTRAAPPPALHGRAYALLLLLLGCLALAAALLLRPSFVRAFAEDKELAGGAASALATTRLLLGGSGALLALLGLAGLRWDLFRALNGRERLTRLAFTLTPLVFLLYASELLLANYPLPTLRAELEQSIPYVPAAYAVHRIADFDHRLLDRAEGRLRAELHNGYRGPAFPPVKPAGEIRIVFLGGSFVFDTKAYGDDDWPHRVERALHGMGFPQVRVINAGVPGHTTFDSIGRLLSEIRLYEPDWVVLCHAWNDMKYFNRIDAQRTPLRVIEPLARPTHAHYPPSAIRAALDRLALFRLARALPRLFGHYGEEGRRPEGAYADTVAAAGIEQYRVNAACFADICRNIGAEPVLCTQPHLPTAGNREAVERRVGYYWVLLSHAAVCEAFAGCEASLHAVAEEKGCALIDLAARFSGDESLFVDHVHLNRRGSEAIAAATAEALAEILR